MQYPNMKQEIGLRDSFQETGLEIIIIRPPLVYGPGENNIAVLAKALSLRIPLPFGSVKHNRRSMIALDNLLDIVKVCALHPKAANQLILISDDQDLSTYSLLRLLGDAINKPALLFKMLTFF